MYKYVFLVFCLLGVTIGLIGKDKTAEFQSGVASFKIKAPYKGQILLRGNTIGISSIDSKLRGIGITKLQNRFQTNPKRYLPGLPDLSMIYTVTFDPTLSPIAVCNLLQNDSDIQYA